MIKLKDLKNIESALPKLVNTEMPIKIAFQLSLVIDEIHNKLVKFENLRVKLVKKYGKENVSGNLEVLPEHRDSFSNELHELLDSDIELTPVEIPLEVFSTSNTKVTIRELNSLINMGFIKNQDFNIQN